MTRLERLKQIIIFLMICFFSADVFSESAPVASSSKDISAFTNWPIVLLVLIGMIAFIFSLAWFIKRFGGMNFSGNREMKVVTSIPLGTRERIALIDVKGKQFLIGVTTQQITHLHSFDTAIIPTEVKENNIKQNDFVMKLQSVLNPAKTTEEISLSETEKREGHAP